VRDGKAYAVGINGQVLARRGKQWQLLKTGLDLARDLHSVWIDDKGGVWAVGGHVIGPPSDAARSPAAGESCNAIDDDCDGHIDESLPTLQRYIDADGDSYPGTPVMRCAQDPGSAPDATDCMDGQPLVHPDQSGFFSSPACPTGTQPCDDQGEWHCRASASDACTSALPAARWDYNCDNHDEQTPPEDNPCGSGDCSLGCGTSGFQPVSSTRCGEPQPYQVCRCLGAQGGGCSGAVQMLPMTCR
jgi:hypothetical protein